ncbi:hypothetical protein LTR28_008807, partial [Elasticomyces elasticus]
MAADPSPLDLRFGAAASQHHHHHRTVNTASARLNSVDEMVEPEIERPDLRTVDSTGTVDSNTTSGPSEASDNEDANGHEPEYTNVDSVSRLHLSPISAVDGLTPLSSAQGFLWTPSSSTRSGSMGGSDGGAEQPAPPPLQTQPSTASVRPTRPIATRQPSNAYNPPRRPHQYSLNTTAARARNQSGNRSRRNPNAEYRAQEKAYVQRIRQDAPGENDFFDGEPSPPSLDYSGASEDEDVSPSTADYVDDPYDQETLLYYGNDDMEPSAEELKIPANRERLEWHSMLANVLTGDVVKQEKKRLIGGTEQQGDNSLKAEVWLGVRAKTCGRSIAAQRRMIEDGRNRVQTVIESIIAFEIKGEAEVGKAPMEQVEDIVKKIEKIEGLYPTRQAFEAANTRAASPA